MHHHINEFLAFYNEITKIPLDERENEDLALKKYSFKAEGIYYYLNFILQQNAPISIVEKQHFRDLTHYPVTTRKYITSVLECLEQIIQEKITQTIAGKKIVLIFDGWSSSTRKHYLAIFGRFINNKGEIQEILLSKAPLIDQTNQNAVNHLASINMVLSYYKKTLNDVICFVGDNCSTNLKLAELAKVPLIGCAAHRLNLVVQKYLKQYEAIIRKVDLLMMELRVTTIAAKFEQITEYKSLHFVPTRWNSYFTMLERFLELIESITKMNLKQINDLMPTNDEIIQIRAITNGILTSLNSVNKHLQKKDTTMLQTRQLFNAIIKDYNHIYNFNSYLGTTAAIIKWKNFENGIVKLQADEPLNELEKSAVARLLLSNNNAITNTSKSNDYATKILKENRQQKKYKERNEYINPKIVSPTSVIVECFFNIAGSCLTNRRQKLSPYHLECLLYARVNKEFWDMESIEQCFGMIKIRNANNNNNNNTDTMDVDQNEEEMDQSPEIEIDYDFINLDNDYNNEEELNLLLINENV